MVDQSFKNMKQFLGSWRLLKKNNFDEFLKDCGINYLLRKASTALTPTETMEHVEDDVWRLR